MIDRTIKQSLGQLMKGVQVIGAAHGGVRRAYTSHWFTQVSFDEPVVMASISPKHDTYPLLRDAACFAVSVLAGDQVSEGQYFSYPGRKFHHVASEYLVDWPGQDRVLPVVPNAIAWLRCETFDRVPMRDHELVFAEVTAVEAIRLREPPLLYSSRLGWRITGDRAREPGTSIRDQLLARLEQAGLGAADLDDDTED